MLKLPINYQEVTIAVLGNANSGKSSLVGVLTNPQFQEDIASCLDDGNGKSRETILRHPHEKKTGRTSSVSYTPMVIGNKVISFVDLAGHESYIHTTISGVTSAYPDFAIVCIEKSVTRVTKEHIMILMTMRIPILFLFTKIDIIPKIVVKKNISTIKKITKKFGKMIYQLRSNEDMARCLSITKLSPYTMISNKEGIGLQSVYKFLGMINPLKKQFPKAFVIDKIYNVKGYGCVITGINGIEIKIGDKLNLGPIEGKYINVVVRTMHNDYRNFVDVLPPNTRGCLCIRIPKENTKFLRRGLVAFKDAYIPLTQNFKAEIVIFNGHATSITSGYTTYLNSGIFRGPVEFIDIKNEKGEKIDCVRSGDKSFVDIRFTRRPQLLQLGDKFLFREGNIKGIGKVFSLD